MYLHKFNKNIFSLWQKAIGNIGYITKALTEFYIQERQT